ncbi:MAG TPA: ABC transporter permease [Bryobacteraceae bacterium]|jgi:predicted permease
MDLKIGLRSLRKNPGFAFLAVAVLALGIGANTAIFSVVNAVLLRPLAYRDPDRIVTLTTAWESGGERQGPWRFVSLPDFEDWSAQSGAFDGMAFYNTAQIPVSVSGAAEYARGAEISPEFLQVFQIHPMLGAQAGRGSAAGRDSTLIAYAFWQTHFGGSPGVLGQTFRAYDRTLTITGVMPQGFAFPDGTEFWTLTDAASEYEHYRSLLHSPSVDKNVFRGGLNYQAVARLKRGVSLPQAQSQMTSIAARLERQYPDTNKYRSVAVTRLRDDMVSGVRDTLYLLLAATGVILLIACANTATLLLARTGARTREIAVRAAVGASPLRIVRQLTAESLLLALLGGAVGLLFAGWTSAALVALAPSDVPRLADAGVDHWVFGFALAASVLATLLSGLAPALHASRVDLNEALKSAARSTIGGKTGRLRAALVVAEVAFSVMLVCAAGLLIRSFVALNNVALGFRPENVLTMKTTAPMPPAQMHAFFANLLQDIHALPGVVAAGATSSPPGWVESGGAYWVDRIPEKVDVSTGTADTTSIDSPGVFQTLRIPLVSGRDFNDGDSADGPPVAIVNQAVVRASFPSGDAVGHMIWCPFDSLDRRMSKIVGVVGDIHQYGPQKPVMPECILPYQQHGYNNDTLRVVVRTAARPEDMEATLRRVVRQHSPDVSVSFTTMAASLAENTAAPRFRTFLLGVFAGLALALAMAGVYGVMSYVAGQRAGEIGLRMTLGASPSQIARLLLGQGLALAGAGVLIGLIGAAIATRLLTSMLFAVKPTDPLTYAAVAGVLGAVTLCASYVPARRAAKADPLVSLRQE